MKYTLKHPDTVGAINSSLCVAHCFATPFLFLTQAQTSLVELSSVPLWWQLLNYVFIIVSFFQSSQKDKQFFLHIFLIEAFIKPPPPKDITELSLIHI